MSIAWHDVPGARHEGAAYMVQGMPYMVHDMACLVQDTACLVQRLQPTMVFLDFDRTLCSTKVAQGNWGAA